MDRQVKLVCWPGISALISDCNSPTKPWIRASFSEADPSLNSAWLSEEASVKTKLKYFQILDYETLGKRFVRLAWSKKCSFFVYFCNSHRLYSHVKILILVWQKTEDFFYISFICLLKYCPIVKVATGFLPKSLANFSSVMKCVLLRSSFKLALSKPKSSFLWM